MITVNLQSMKNEKAKLDFSILLNRDDFEYVVVNCEQSVVFGIYSFYNLRRELSIISLFEECDLLFISIYKPGGDHVKSGITIQDFASFFNISLP